LINFLREGQLTEILDNVETSRQTYPVRKTFRLLLGDLVALLENEVDEHQTEKDL
jgi:hypothetical protein